MIPPFNSKLESLYFFSNECIENMKQIEFKHSKEEGIQKAYAATLKYISKNEEAAGGCHFISSMLHILLEEQGIENTVAIGEVQDHEANIIFSHSWVEINGDVFDPAIMHTLDGAVHPPVYYGVNLSTLEPPNMMYGVSANKEDLDIIAKQLLPISITSYLDNIKQQGFPKNYLWDEIIKAGTGILGYTNTSRLRKKYDNHYRIFKFKNNELPF